MSVKAETPNVVTAVTAVQVRQGEEGAFAGWLTELNKTIATFPGYVSAVVIPPVPPLQSDWVMVQRFQTIEELRAWLDSDARRSLLDESASLLVDEGTTNVIQGTNTELSPHDMVTEIITVSVKPGMEEAYRDWVDRVRQVEAKFPGYQGLQLQPPIPGLQDDWVSLLRFDTSEHLNAWLESDARRVALEEVEPFIDKREQQVATAFSGWFTFGDAPGQVPPNWKQSMIVLLTLYPIVMLEQLFLNPLLHSLGMAEAIFIGNLISVAATGFLLIPLALRAFEWWLLPRPNDSTRVEAAGIALVIVLYAVSIAVFAWFT
ncbi:MAG: antibiotic biosynthesis monooxygenase [Actinomycetota bacterium]|nr:antibiotic biosynthesis monooxygenase [Actinomycetota bacterium]